MGLVVTDAMGNTIVVDVEAPTPPKPSPVASDSPAHMPPHKAARAHLSEISSYQPQAEDPPSTPRNSRDESVANQSQAIQYTADDKRKSRAPHGDNIIVPTTTDAKCAAAADAGESTELPLPCSTESVSPLELDKKEILSNVTAVGEAVKEQCTTTEILVPASSEHSPVSNASDTVDIVTPEVNVRPASGGEDSPVVSAKKNSVPTSPRGHGASNDTDARSDLAISTTDLPPEAQSHSTAMRKGRQSPGKLVIEPQNNAFNPPLTRQRSSNSKAGLHTNALIAYNQYGDIVKVKDMKEPQDPSKLTATETLRLINKVYGFELRSRMNEVIALQMGERTYAEAKEEGEEGEERSKNKKSKVEENATDGKEREECRNAKSPDPPLVRSLLSWEYSPFPLGPLPATPEGLQMTLVYDGPPRVLEIGCGDGSWCFASKERHPDWIIEGVDDVDHWTQAWPDLAFKGFIHPDCAEGTPKEYFKGFKLNQKHPEFVVRNLNALLAHNEPFPYNLYGLIRGRDIFDRIESYKEFLEDVRLILQPDGVIEFVELDPRPRADFMDGESLKYDAEEDLHVSGPETNWTDKIVDRFKAQTRDHELATTVEGWAKRAQERHKAIFRPKDGVPAPQLKGWLEGAGFWDVNEIIFRLQVGGETRGGKLLLDALEAHLEIEDGIPLLKAELPRVELQSLESGDFFLNLHIVTGRKPKWPRPGDLLLDGTRQEMTNVKYDQMAKLNDAKSNQWKRFDLDGKLSSMMQSLGKFRTREDSSASAGVGGESALTSPLSKATTANVTGVMSKGTESPRCYRA